MAGSNLQWFRVEFKSDGSVESVTPWEQREQKDGVLVVYFQAHSREAAVLRAEQFRIRQASRLAQAKRRAAYKAAGKCPDCGRTPLPHRVKCEVCQERRKERYRRPKGDRIRETRATREQQERLATLLEVEDVLRRQGAAYLVRWLRTEIDKLAPGARKVQAA